MAQSRIILDLCGGTGAWSKPYADAGYDVRVITLPYWNVVKYAEMVIDEGLDDLNHSNAVHGVLAAPPCDHFSVSGAQYWPRKDEDGRTDQALDIVDACFDLIDFLGPVWWAMENPVGRLRGLREHRFVDLIGTNKPVLIFNPCDYGDPYTKKTLLWGDYKLPAKAPVDPIRSCKQGSHLQKLGGKSEKTKRLRSITPPRFAKAFFEANK